MVDQQSESEPREEYMENLEVKFTINNRELVPEELEDGLLASVLQDIEKDVRRKAGKLRCAEHGEFASVTVTGPSPKQLRLHVEGCCDNLINQVSDALR
jgi:hypothetical protein